MNAAEKAVVNNPVMQALGRWYVAPVLLRLGGRLLGARAVEIGCGAGHGIGPILASFGAATVDGVDLDADQVARAHRRWASDLRVRLAQGSATDLRTALGAGDGTYDAAFDVGVVHHIEDWRAALAEVARVLRPGGRFYFVEVTAHALARPTYRLLFDHPTADRFTARQFLDELPRYDLTVLGWRTRVRGDYLLGVASKHSHDRG